MNHDKFVILFLMDIGANIVELYISLFHQDEYIR